MKKAVIALLVAALGLLGLAVAEPAGPTVIENRIEEGGYVIRIPVQDEGAGWVADDMSQNESVVRLETAAVEDGAFVVRYAPVADGEVTVSIRHYAGIACDTVFTWDLRVAGGQVAECTGGSMMESPEAADMEPYMSGEWTEEGEDSGSLFIERAGDGFAVQYIAPGRDGATAFNASASYDCQMDAFVYADGAFRSVPITETDEAAEGELIAENTTGSFERVPGDEAAPIKLTWYNSLRPESALTFVPAASKTVEPMAETVDLNDGTYPVAFDRAELSDGTLSGVHVFTEDCYDIVDMATLAVGDSIVIDGQAIQITALGGEDHIEINGGALNGGYDIWPFEEDNCYRVVLDDDFPTYTDHGEATLPLDANVTFTDGWNIDAEPLTVTGAAEVEKAIRESENDAFNAYNTTLRIEGGSIVEINRRYVP